MFAAGLVGHARDACARARMLALAALMLVGGCGWITGIYDYATAPNGAGGAGAGGGGAVGGSAPCTPHDPVATQVGWFYAPPSGTIDGGGLAVATSGDRVVTAGRMAGQTIEFRPGQSVDGEDTIYLLSLDAASLRSGASEPVAWALGFGGIADLALDSEDVAVVLGEDGSAYFMAAVVDFSAAPEAELHLGSATVTIDNANQEELVLGRVDPDGSPRWLIPVGGSGWQANPRAVVADGTLLVAFSQGEDQPAATLGGRCDSLSGPGVVVARLSLEDGACQRAVLLGVEAASLDLASSAADGSVVLGGVTTDPSFFPDGIASRPTLFVLELSPATLEIEAASVTLFPSGDNADGFDVGPHVMSDGCGGVVVAGTMGAPVSLDIGGTPQSATTRTAFVVKVDQGVVAWQRVFPGLGPRPREGAGAQVGDMLAVAGRLVLVGDLFQGSSVDFGAGPLAVTDPASDAFVALFSLGSQGPELAMSRSFGVDGELANGTHALAVAADPIGNVVVAGKYAGPVRVNDEPGGVLPDSEGASFVLGLDAPR
jgi:hypothetical protein